ncbi:alpha/beta hydrolase [Piscinibacter sakaiensis]|uniref:Putative esterase n=1 Tax=Piscinibacter sakaiensis TaxID=1547922 RepID=A0A0K8NYA0_PISS1|nr:alpha/beta hydrolase [Piscinibacter sakaiensis]GAP35348.1 putative esterase [Piscinibacter sakaiensis]
MTSWDPAWLERQYDNRARVPEHPAILQRWAQASAMVRERLDADLDRRYGPTPAETLDVFPAEQPGSPVLVFIHGGWWRALDKSDHSFVAPAFVRAGAMVVVPNYALCPAVSVETIALQMVRALVWTWRHASRYGGDPRRIVVAGHSAGGHLATMMLSCDWRSQGADLPAVLVPSALSVSGVVDLAPVAEVGFLKPDLRLTPQAVARLSPVRFPAPPAATLVCAAGALESEEFLRQNAAMREAWGPGVVTAVETVADANHFTVLHALVDAGEPLHRHALDLLGLEA